MAILPGRTKRPHNQSGEGRNHCRIIGDEEGRVLRGHHLTPATVKTLRRTLSPCINHEKILIQTLNLKPRINNYGSLNAPRHQAEASRRGCGGNGCGCDQGALNCMIIRMRRIPKITAADIRRANIIFSVAF